MTMERRIDDHIRELLMHAPRTRGVVELHEELLAGCLDKYQDLIQSGMPPEDAYETVIAGIGDVDELVRQVVHLDTASPFTRQRSQERRAAFTTVGIMLALLSLAVFFMFRAVWLPEVGIGGMLLVLTVAVGCLVYGNLSTQTGNVAATLLPPKEHGQAQALRKAISSTLWSFTTIIYLLFSFLTHRWDYSWIIFLIASAVESGISLYFSPPQNRGRHWQGLMWTATTALYFAVSFMTHRWDMTWVLFLITAALTQAARLYGLWRNV